MTARAHSFPANPMSNTGSSDPREPNALSALLQPDTQSENDRPVSPNMTQEAQIPGRSPHRFVSSAMLFEVEPRSRKNRFVQDEAGCEDMAEDDGKTTDAPDVVAQSPGLVPAKPSFMVPDVERATSSLGQAGDSLLTAPASGPLMGQGLVNQGSFTYMADGEEGASANMDALIRRLRGAHFFSVLPRDELQFTAEHMRVFVPKRDEICLDYGAVCTGAYVVLRGRVAVFRPSRTVSNKFDSTWWLGRGDVFGFDYVITQSHSHRKYQVMCDDAVLGFLDYHVLFKIIRSNPAFAQSMARKMSEDMNVFRVFKDYARAVFAPTVSPDNSVVNFRNVLEKFGKINNGIYPEMHAAEIDTGAWTYALRRLPENITRTLVIELAKAPPPMMAALMRRLSDEYDRDPARARPRSDDGRIAYVPCKVRRRASYSLPNGKTLVILRDSTTDLLDFMSCMCVHLNESEKLRQRLINQTDPQLVNSLEEALEHRSLERITELMKKLPFDEDEAKGLINLWKEDTIRNMYDIVTTRRDDLLVRVDLRVFRRFYRTPTNIFASNIRHEILRRLGLPEDGDLPPNLIIDVISSNAHSVKNLLSPYPRKKREDIMHFARVEHAKDTRLRWDNSEDLLYYMLSKYMDRNDHARHEFADSWKDAGLTVIELTSMTGLEVDIVDVSGIDAEHVDGTLRDAAREANHRLKSPYAAPHYIVNLDFPFGHQAESVMKSLSVAFGSRIRSVNIMGKGGGIVGKRGDIQFPTHVLLSKSSVPFDDFVDELRPCGQQDISPEMLMNLTNGSRGVHVGPVVTIAGTMSQNAKLLRYYKHLWGCVGMEMEGSYYSRAIKEAVEQRVLRADLKTRFLYYTSDTPLASAEESLAAGMTPTEGVPSVYAVMRAFLCAILNDTTGPAVY